MAVAWPLYIAVAWPPTWLCAGAAGRGGDAAGSAATTNDASAAALQSSSHALRRVIPQPCAITALHRPGSRSGLRFPSAACRHGHCQPVLAVSSNVQRRPAGAHAVRGGAPLAGERCGRARALRACATCMRGRACMRWSVHACAHVFACASVCVCVCVRGRLRRQLRCGRRSSGYRASCSALETARIHACVRACVRACKQSM